MLPFFVYRFHLGTVLKLSPIANITQGFTALCGTTRLWRGNAVSEYCPFLSLNVSSGLEPEFTVAPLRMSSRPVGAYLCGRLTKLT